MPLVEFRRQLSNWIPFLSSVRRQGVAIADTSVQTKTMEKLTTQTKDGQWLNTNIDVKYKINESYDGFSQSYTD